MAGEDLALARRLIAGDEAAFEELAEGTIPALYRFASRRLPGDPELTREIVQATMCAAIANLRSFRGEATLLTWLCACCRNEITAHFRRRKRFGKEVELEEAEGSPPAGGSSGGFETPEHAMLRGETAQLVHAALDSLPPHYGRALEWKYLEDLSVNDIARRMNLAPKAAESLLTRARQAFRNGYASLVAAAHPAVAPLGFARQRVRSES